MTSRVPELSLREYTEGDSQRREAFCTATFAALHEYGFLLLKDHTVPVALLDEAYSLSTVLFALGTDEKQRFRSGLRGYTPFGTEHAKNHSYPDLKEFWQIGREVPPDMDLGESFAPNIWPTNSSALGLAGFRDTFLRLYAGLDETARLLLEALTPALQLPQYYFDSHVRSGNSVLRIIHYPPVPQDADPLCLRAAPHEDINFLTILVAARGAGLELLNRDGRWFPLESSPRSLIVNSGDMLARLTNGVIPAKTHRVVNPAGPNVSRYSMPFFMHPTSATSLRCLPSCVGAGAQFPEISAGEFLAERLREIGLNEP